ncbi:unnamed protein product [marine sediment metagenome]|uniref:Uncharacterized protein n=1 Tax=marine sediment metagenome TaxID=412755 RepID=X0VP19_9ZZZZ
MPATALEAQHIEDSGPTEVQMTYVNPDAAVSITNHEIVGSQSDSGKLMATIIAASEDVATRGILATDETGQVWIAGRFRVPKDITVPLVQGHTAYWDKSTNKATTNAVANQADDFALGMVVKSASTSQAYVDVDINTGPYAFDIGT